MIHKSTFQIDAVMAAHTDSDPQLSEFRDEVRTFAADRLPRDIRERVHLGQHLSKEDHLRWHRILAERGWLVGHWPEEFGGLGWSRLQRWIFENEVYRAGSPWLVPFGVTYVAPIIYSFGTDAQKQRFLHPIARAETWWAQGYSEPGAGSDLASLKTSAVRDGDHYVVNGHKIWTTMAQWADMMFTLVRTDNEVAPQRGISFLLIDLRSPGVTIRPIKTIDFAEHLNEIFLDDVRVPVENLVGEEGRGWTYAKVLLGNERLLAAEIGKAQRMMARLEHLLATTGCGSSSLRADRAWRRRVAELGARMMALESLSYEFFREAEGGKDPGAAASTLKIIGADLIQAISAAMVDIFSYHGPPLSGDVLDGVGGTAPSSDPPPDAPGAIAEYLYGRAASIYGGSSEIQRNIISKSVLGL